MNNNNNNSEAALTAYLYNEYDVEALGIEEIHRLAAAAGLPAQFVYSVTGQPITENVPEDRDDF